MKLAQHDIKSEAKAGTVRHENIGSEASTVGHENIGSEASIVGQKE